jgi:hypothetical protein
LVDELPVQSLCQALAGAGEAIVAAGAHQRAGRRDAAFQRLVQDWIRAGGPDLDSWFTSTMQDLVGDAVAGEGPLLGASPEPPLPSPRPLNSEASRLPSRGQLRLARYVAAHTFHESVRAGSVLLHVAVPPGQQSALHEPWRMTVLDFDGDPQLSLRSFAFSEHVHFPVAGDLEIRRNLR